MNLNALLIRGAVFMVFATILAFSAIRPVTTAQAQSTVASTSATAPVELPTITVRPSAADLIEARGETTHSAGVLIETSATEQTYGTLTPNMPSLRMDMPYYSFGKALRRVKE